MRISPSPQTKVAAAFALVIAIGTLVALVVTKSAGVADLLLVAMLLAVSLMALSNHRDTRRQSGR